MNLKHLAFIPARGGSKGVPGKNMRLINGKPLLSFTLDWASSINLFSDIFVSTDCPITLQYAIEKGSMKAKLRPYSEEIDFQSADELILQCQESNYLDLNNYDYLWYLQPTSPCRKFKMVDDILFKIKEFYYPNCLISVKSVPEKFNSAWQYSKDEEGFLYSEQKNNISRRQDLKKKFIRDGRFYITKTSHIINKKKLIGKKFVPIILDNYQHVNVDTLDDWFEAKKLCAEYSF
tara:strand:- start:100 stop:801 length:702 start_codon:yes stop_codon:yes gene_type:complete